MSLVRFRTTVWNTPAFQPVLKWCKAYLAIETGAIYRIGPGAGQEWIIFDDSRFTLDHFATLGAIAAGGPGPFVGWEPPLHPDGSIDREATEAEIASRITVVDPADITYPEDDPNVYQTTLDAQSAPATIAAEPATEVAWRAQGGDE